jgi:hypothetical protein
MDSPISPQNRTSVHAAGSLTRHKWLILPLSALAIASLIGPSEADPGPSLAGSWSGGGWVAFSTGNKERASCRASYRQNGGDSYTLLATCATSSGKASQTATVYKVSANRYRGSFYNSDFNVHGTIRVAVNGSSQSVDLSGEGASASLSLHKR